MMTRWDSLRSHNGCLSLFDLTDLTDKIRRLALKQEEKERASAAADVRPRQYRFRRVTPMELLQQQEERRRQQQQAAAGAGAGEGGPAVSARRVLLPAVQTEDEAAVGADIASFLEEQQSRLAGGGKGRVLGGEGLVVFVDDADSKVRVMRDRRSKEDLVAAFPDVDAAIVDDVWARTRLFAAASTILASLRNSGHTELAHHLNMDLRLDDPAVWPTLEEVFGADDATAADAGAASATHPLAASGHSVSSSVTSSGWEHVAFPDGGSGDHWVLIEEEVVEGGAGGPTAVAPALIMGDMAALALAEETEEEQEAEEEAAAAAATAAPTGAGRMSYRDALTANTMDGDEGATGLPSSRRFFPLAGMAARRKRAKVAEKQARKGEDDEEGWEGGGSGWGFQEEYALTKAVSVRTRKHCGRKRLTETGKARMAAKLAKRQEAKQGAGGSGDEGGDDAMEW